MGRRVWVAVIVMLVVVWGRLTCAAEPVTLSEPSLCPVESIMDSISGFPDFKCSVNGDAESHKFVGVTDGDEVSLQRALNMVYKNTHEYVAVLFFASWCPFSRTFRPSFSILSSLYPSIPHFAIEELSIRPSILSKYGVHGFPTLFLLNSTMHARYHGMRTVGSLVAFYSEVTGIKTAAMDRTSLDQIGCPSNHEKNKNSEQESCPFTWARSPENLFRQETYLALAATFVLLRLLYFLYPTLLVCGQCVWGRRIRNVSLRGFWEHPLTYLNRAIQLLNSLRSLAREAICRKEQ